MPKNARRRQKGDGSIFRRGNIYYVKLPPALKGGKPETYSSRDLDKGRLGTESDAKLLLNELKAERVTARIERRDEAISEVTCDVVFDSYLKAYREKNKERGFVWAKMVVETFVRPVFGKINASEITTPMLKAYRKQRREKVQDPTINRELSIFRAALNHAVKEDGLNLVVPHFPITSEKNRVRQGFIEADDYKRILNEMPWTIKPVFVIGYHVGARRDEITGIEWADVDLSAKTIFLHGKSGPRKIPIYGEMMDWILLWKRIRERYFPKFPHLIFHFGGQGGSGLIEEMVNAIRREDQIAEEVKERIRLIQEFQAGTIRQVDIAKQLGITPRRFNEMRHEYAETGKVAASLRPINVKLYDSPMAYKNIYGAWNAACERAGFPDLIPHDMRRTAARLMEQHGIPRTLIMKVLGHKTESMFIRYRIVSNREAQVVGDMMDRAMNGDDDES